MSNVNPGPGDVCAGTLCAGAVNPYIGGVLLRSMIDPLGNKTAYTWNLNLGKPLTLTKPGGEVISSTYDSRGNELTATTTSAGGGASLTIKRIYPISCSVTTIRTCNKPTAIIDANGTETDYTWSTIHGGMLTETKPPDANGYRGTTTYSYTAYTGIDGATFYMLTSISEPIDSSHSKVTTYEYDPSDHWEKKSEIVNSGGQSLRTCFRHDAVGNIISKTAPDAALSSCP